MKVFAVSDPALYMSHTLAFINFDAEVEKAFSRPEAFLPLLARAWGILKEPVLKVLEERRRAVEAQDANREKEELLHALELADPENPLIEEIRNRIANPIGQSEIEQVKRLLGEHAPTEDDIAPRQLVEHVALTDTLDLTDIQTVASRVRDRGDIDEAARIEQSAMVARDQLGISEIRVVNDFPIALCAFGFTRVSRSPSASVLRPFPPDEDGRFPLYVLPVETEGIWFQLSPVRVYNWLVQNGLLDGSEITDSSEAWANLYSNVPSLWQTIINEESPERAAIRTLLHTLSHILLGRIEWSGFASSSVGEYLLPGALSFVLYINRYAGSKIGGLTTLFEQRLDTWLWDAVQAGQECVYDPLCSDEGGSCVGCLHREYNCPLFNRELSRSMLYGGPTPQAGVLDGHTIKHGYWENAWSTTPER